jgi:hypothetical protein
MKALLLVSIIATGMALTASVRPVASVPDFVGSFRSITLIGEARAQSRRDVRCRRVGTPITVIIAIWKEPERGDWSDNVTCLSAVSDQIEPSL